MKKNSLLFTMLMLGPIASAQAQPFPNKPIEIVVPSSPGGGVDLLFRLLGEELSKTAKVQVNVSQSTGGRGRHRRGESRQIEQRRLHAVGLSTRPNRHHERGES